MDIQLKWIDNTFRKDEVYPGSQRLFLLVPCCVSLWGLFPSPEQALTCMT